MIASDNTGIEIENACRGIGQNDIAASVYRLKRRLIPLPSFSTSFPFTDKPPWPILPSSKSNTLFIINTGPAFR